MQFQIDANGILSVTARELRTDIEQTIEVKPSYGLTDDEVEPYAARLLRAREADFAARLLIEARNEAEKRHSCDREIAPGPDFAELAKTELARGERERIEDALAQLKGSWAPPSRDHPGEDPRAQRRDAHLAEFDHEPIGAGGVVGQERQPDVGAVVGATEQPMPKSPSSSTEKSQTVEFEHGKLPYTHHGKPESFLDLAKNSASRWSTPAAGAAPARRATSSSPRARRTSARCRTTKPTASTPPGA